MATSRAQLSAAQALAHLQEGNQRFAQGLRSLDTMVRAKDLPALAEMGQLPFCIVLTCSDSRIPTEILFDRGPGDIFVVRVEGNVATPSQIASIEFAAAQYGVPLCLVMGHTGCGAISAALDQDPNTPHESPNLHELIVEIQPATREAKRIEQREGRNSREHLVKSATHLNVQNTIQKIEQRSRLLSGLRSANRIQFVGAVCDLSAGKVMFDVAHDVRPHAYEANRV